MKCPNHPEKNVLSFCHSCGDYLCRECLTDGEEYYFCKKQECQNAKLTEKTIVNNIESGDAVLLKQNDFAGFWRRVAALLIDYILLSLTGIVFGIIAGILFELFIEQFKHVNDKEIAIIGNLISIIISWLYFSLLESSPLQGTIGKLVLNIKVTDLYQKRINFGKATGRYFCKILSGLMVGIGFIMAGFTKDKQALHDLLAGTLVIKKKAITLMEISLN